MSELRRYLPIRELEVESIAPIGNFSAVERESTVLQVLVELFEPAVAPLGAIALVTLLAIVALFLLTAWYGRGIAEFARQYTIQKLLKLTAPEESFEYTYSGIKLVLRKYYLKIRESVGCRRCTPREIVEKCGRREYEEFARIYEDVVYGSKEMPAGGSRVLVKLGDSI
ncbi:MAG: hypothetical protein RMH84_03925 [Sulfolobales archaeon]|nr:hypothetical protein [Sulfolobales archaeon]MCX8209314.1 hypothetical protein [Sulfolobales archaeon]MDW8010722.1 hypothetical protein [Sulfolobales archaeon]